MFPCLGRGVNAGSGTTGCPGMSSIPYRWATAARASVASIRVWWDMLPHDLPAKSTAYDDFARWRADGTWQRMMDARRQEVRAAAGREPSPSAASIDSQTVKGTEVGGERRDDGGKNLSGVKRHIVVDTSGLLLVAVDSAASADDGRTPPRCWGG